MYKAVTFSRLGLAIMLLTISVGPFFQGYFFPKHALAAMVATASAFGLWALVRRGQRLSLNLLRDRTGTLLLALAAWCLLATVWAVYVRDNITLVLQVLAAFATFVLVREESTDGVRRALVWLLSLSALAVALLGLLEYSGFFMDHPALGVMLQVERQGKRIFTVFQYPNSAAVFFLIALLLSNARLIVSDSWVEKILLGAGSAVIVTAFTFTLSRGGLLVAPIGVLLFCLGLSRHQILLSLLYWVTAAGVPIALTITPIAHAASGDSWQTVLLWTLVSAMVSAVTTGVLHALVRLPGRVQTIAGVVLLAALVAGGVVGVPHGVNQLPKAFTRVLQVSIEDLTSDGRLEFLRDAGRLAIRRPWGYGGGGWLRTYTQVQRYNYVARDPHSHYALTLVEAGVPGLAFLLGAIGCAAFHAFRSRRGAPLRWAMGAAALTLATHAAVDVDLSYYVLWLLLWTLLAAAQPEAAPVPVKPENRLVLSAVVTLAGAVVLLCSTMFMAAQSYEAAEAAALVNDSESAIVAGNRAIRLDPLNSLYRTVIPTPENINRALELDPQNEELWRFVSYFLEEQGNSSGALAAAWRALQLRPMSVTHYERVTDLLTSMMISALEEGRATDATSIAQEVIALGYAMEERGKPSLERQELLFRAYPPLTWTPRLSLAAGQAYLVVGDLEAAEAHLKEALTSRKTSADAALWLHALYTITGNQEGLARLKPRPSQQALQSRLYATLITMPAD